MEITDQTTEIRQVLANPNGTFTMKASQRAVRVKQDGVWKPIDTTLRRNPDGSLSPIATDQNVSFSGGGTAPLVTVRRGELALAFSWPVALPTPVISGDTVTYPAVLPGVDLRLRAERDSYSQVLIVHDANAAANPALAHIRLTATGTGLSLTVQADGSLSARDANGAEVLRGPQPIMWDSRHNDPLAPPPSATDISTGRVTPISITGTPSTPARGATATSATDLTLTPDPAALTGADVVYPLYLDPSMSVHKWHWLRVTDRWGPHYDDPAAVAQVGYCGGWDDCDGYWHARSYFQLDISPLWYRNNTRPTIWRAEFFATQIWAAAHDCGSPGHPTAVHVSDEFSANTQWPGPMGEWLNTQFSNGGGPCPARTLVFNVWQGARYASDGHWSSLGLGLRAPDEGNPYQWKKFDNNPLLEVDYSFPPNIATGQHLSNEVTCTGSAVTPDARPTLMATATDNNNPPLQLGLGFEVWDKTGSTMHATTTQLNVINSGGTAAWRTPNPIPDGEYAFRTAVSNIHPSDPGGNLWAAGWSAWYYFRIRATPPAQAPQIINTFDYPVSYWGAPAGAPGSIAVSANGAAHIMGYAYTFAGSGTETVPNTGDCDYNRTFGTSGGWIPNNYVGTNWIPIPTGLTPGYHTLRVRSFDDAHNLSPEAAYTFYVAANTGQTAQRFEAESLPRSQPAGQNLLLGPQPNCCNVNWSNGSQLYFGGTGLGQSFSVSFNTTLESDYQIAIGLTRADDFGQVSFRLDNQPIGQNDPTRPIGSFDAYNPVVSVAHQPLGIRHLTAGTHTLTVTTTGTNSAAVNQRYAAGIDYLDLARITRFEADDGAQLTWSVPNGQSVRPTPQTVCSCWNTAWSGGTQLLFSSSAKDTSFDLTFQAPIEADYALGANLTKANDYGKLTFVLDGKPLLSTDTAPWDGYNPTVTSSYKPLGGAHLTMGAHKLTIKVVDTNPASINARYLAGIDYLSVVPINNVTAANLTAAMNNHGISADGTVADLDLGFGSLSAQAMTAAGYGPGTTATVNGATFTMPPTRSDGMDNVIAIGQTIPFPAGQQIKASAVGLLVAATCGATPDTSGAISYTDDTTQNTPFAKVDDWVGMPTDFASLTLPYRNDGAASNPTLRPRLRALFVPADPSKTLKSITLPNYGTSLVPRSCSPALHVLAIAPRPVATGWIGVWTAHADTAKPVPGGGLADKTLRSVIHPTVTGGSVRVRLVNPAGAPVTIDAASLAAQGTDSSTLSAPVALRFGGANGITLPAAGEAISDPIAYPATTGGSGNLAVSLHVPTAVTAAPVHALANAPTYLASGNATADSSGVPFAASIAGSSYIAGVEASTSDISHGTVAVLGDQLTAVAPPGSWFRPTWVDGLPPKLAASGVPLPGGLVNASLAGLPPSGWWKLNDGSGTTARDSAGSATATAIGGATWSTERGGAVSLNGAGSLATNGPVIGTATSYSVSAWVKLSTTGSAAQTVVSQDSGQHSAFALQYTGTSTNKWAFTMFNSTGGVAARVLSNNTVQTGTWTHLLGVYNSASGMADLYVNGDYQGFAASNPAPIASTGPLAIGRGKSGGAPAALLNGAISDVRVYERAANGWDAKILVNGGPASGPQPGLGAPTATDANRYLDPTVLNQPRLRTVIIALGTNDILAGRSASSIETELTELMHEQPTSYTGVRNGRRADGTRIHVIVTTVPPLGLTDNDPREQQRRQLNADILAHYIDYGAHERVDFATSVQDPVRPSQINPAYLSVGVPNSSYHDAVAQAITDAATRFPPEAQL